MYVGQSCLINCFVNRFICTNMVQNKNLLSNNSKLMAEWDYDKNENEGLNPFELTLGSHETAWWKCCVCGHEWPAKIYSRCAGRGCSVCAGREVKQGYNDLATTHPKLAEEWHPTKNGDLKPVDFTKGSHDEVWWICEIGHEYKSAIYSRVAGNGCPYCAGKKVLPGYNDLATTHPKLAEEWHPTKNGNVKPTDVTYGSKNKFWWLCAKGHAYRASVQERVRGRGCSICAGKRVQKGCNYLATTHPVIAKDWHPTKNGYLNPTDVSAYSNINVWWLCNRGHEYPAFIYSRTNGSGCPYCSNRKVWKGYNDLESVYPEIAEEWHPTKNGDLKPSEVIYGYTKKVYWLCKRCGHEWEISVKNRTGVKRSGCPRCTSQGKTSFPEQSIYYYLKQIVTDAENRVQVEKNEIDIYIPVLKTGIEYDGDLYHKSEKAKEREIQKNEALKQLGIRLIRVKEVLNGNFGIQREGDVIYYSRDSSNSYLNDVIRLLVDILFENCILDIDVVRDRKTIQKSYLAEYRANSLESKYPELSKEWHPTKNEGLLPSMFTAGSGEYIWWQCSLCGHEWQTKIHHRTAGSGCPICARKKNKKPVQK